MCGCPQEEGPKVLQDIRPPLKEETPETRSRGPGQISEAYTKPVMLLTKAPCFPSAKPLVL